MRLLIPMLFLPLLAAAALAQGKPRPHLTFTNPPTLSTPTGYTHVVETRGTKTVYISGQVALDRTGNIVGAGDMGAQAKQVFENLKAALAVSGATFEDVVKINTYVTDMTELPAIRSVRASYFGAHAPASTLVQVVRLARPEFLIEIEAIVALP